MNNTDDTIKSVSEEAEELSNIPESKAEGSDAVIEISNLVKSYGGKRAVSNASFSVKRGEIMGFLGPNGAGKSTTMNILTGYLSPTSGSVRVDGLDILEHPSEVKRKIGYLPENPPLYTDMTVSEYLNFVYDLKKADMNREEHLAEVMRLVKITGVKDRMIRNLSKGYKQRVGFAQALIGNPEVLVLDEPTVGLDPKQIIEIRNVIKDIGRERTIILSTHILQEVSAVCDRVTVINGGRIIVSDSLEAIQKNMGEKGKYLLRIAGSEQQARNVLSAVKNIAFMGYVGVKEENTVDFMIEAAEGVDIRQSVFEAFAEAKLPLIGFKSAELSLEEIFIRLTNSAEYLPDEQSEEAKEAKRGILKGFLKRRKEKTEGKRCGGDEKAADKADEADKTEEVKEIEEVKAESEAEENESNIQ